MTVVALPHGDGGQPVGRTPLERAAELHVSAQQAYNQWRALLDARDAEIANARRAGCWPVTIAAELSATSGGRLSVHRVRQILDRVRRRGDTPTTSTTPPATSGTMPTPPPSARARATRTR